MKIWKKWIKRIFELKHFNDCIIQLKIKYVKFRLAIVNLDDKILKDNH